MAFVAVMGATAHPETVSGEIQQRDCPGISPVFPIKSDSTDTQILIANIRLKMVLSHTHHKKKEPPFGDITYWGERVPERERPEAAKRTE